MHHSRVLLPVLGAVLLPLGLLTAPAGSAARPGAAAGPATTTRAVDDGTSARGEWTVRRIDEQAWSVRWTSPEPLPVTADRPRIVDSGTEVADTDLLADRRSVEATVTAETAPLPADLDVLLSGDRLDVAGDDTATVTADQPVTSSATTLPDDPALPGPHDVVTGDYLLPPVKLPRMRRPIEMVGHVVEPAPDADTGPRPLVLFLHGRHSWCYNPGDPEDWDVWDWPCVAPLQEIPSHLGYDYVQRLLASQGYATVSVRVNGINAQDWRLEDGGARARARIVARHLDHWVGLADEHRVDLSRVVLVGHSRGGEGVNRAAIRTRLDAPYRIVGQLLLAPTDFGSQTAPFVPTVTVLPYCDGDVYDLQGQQFTDVSRDITTGDTSLKSSVLLMGANHNYFNTEWTPGLASAPSWDDWSGPPAGFCGTATQARLSPAEQQAAGTALVAGAVRLFADGAQQYLPLFDGSGVTVGSVGDTVMHSHAIGGGRTLRRPGADAGLSLADGAFTQLCVGRLADAPRFCDQRADLTIDPHWPLGYGLRIPTRRALEMVWTEPGQAGGLAFEEPLDLAGSRLELRTVVDPRPGEAALDVRIGDADGNRDVLTPEVGATLPPLPGPRGLRKRWARTVVVDPADASGVDLGRVTTVELVGRSPDGRVWVLDLAAAPEVLAPVPAQRLPQVNLGQRTVEEGDGPGSVVASIPFTVAGTLTRPATLRVQVLADGALGGLGRSVVDLAPGQETGSVRVSYPADRRDDYDREASVVAWAGRHLVTDDYLGRLTIRDDDPTPRLALERSVASVPEGGTATWLARLEAPTGYDQYVQADLVRGRSDLPRVTVGDVRPTWVRRHTWVRAPDPDLPLHRLPMEWYGRIPAGTRTLRLTVPLRDDSRREPAEVVTLRVLGRDGRATAAVPVRVNRSD